MTKNEMKKKLLNFILLKITEVGFEKNIYGQTFWKPVQNGRAAVHLSFIDHETDFDVTVDFAVRIDKLEELKNKDNTYLKEKEKKETATIGVELGNLIEGNQKRWTISSEEDIEKVADEIYSKIVEEGIPYIDKYSNLDNILFVCLKDDEDSMLHSPFGDDRAINAVGLAKMLNRGDIKEIISKKKMYLKESELELSNFQNFLNKIGENEK